MTDQDVRDFLDRMATEEPVQFLEAEPLTRRARRRAARTVIVGAVGVAAAVGVLFAGFAEIRTAPVPIDDPAPAPAPSEDLGIFGPVAGRIVYGDSDGIWGVDPTAPEDPAVQLTTEAGTPLGWSSDGTDLLIMRDLRQGDLEGEMHLVVLHADGSETLVAENQGWIPGAAISPDGSRVVFTSYEALYSVDTGGGSVEVLFRGGEDEMGPPTFSPDGSEIAFTVGGGDHSHRVWMMNADGSDPHEIVANETTMGAGHVNRLAWSPARDRIALGLDQGTYTFGPDGSGFTQVLTDGTEPSWSPDGARVAYTVCLEGPPSCRLGIADADGSNARTYDVATSGPWHPGVPAADEPAPTPIETSSPATPTPDTTTSPPPSTSPGSSRFTSTIHGLSIDVPSGWQTRAATEPWGHDALTFDAPDVDVIFDPTLQDDLYIALASEPLGGLSGDVWCCEDLIALMDTCRGHGGGGGGGNYTLDGAHGWIGRCGSDVDGGHSVFVSTATHGYVIWLYLGNERLQATYDVDWFEALLETVDLRPEALDAASPPAPT